MNSSGRRINPLKRLIKSHSAPHPTSSWVLMNACFQRNLITRPWPSCTCFSLESLQSRSHPARLKMQRKPKIKIAQFGLGPIGLETLKLAATKPWAQIVGGIDIDPNKIGTDLWELTQTKSLRGRKV